MVPSRFGIALAAGLFSSTAFAQQVLNEQTCSVADMMFSLPLHDTDAAGAPGHFEYVAMFPDEDHIGWATDPSDPSSHHIHGVRMMIGDTEGGTSNPFSVWIHTENPAAPGQPDVANATGFQIDSPIGASGPGAFLFDIVFPQPVLLPNDADAFISVELLPEPVADHLTILALAPEDVSVTGSTIWDIGSSRTSDAGHGAGSTGGFGYFIDWAAGQSFFELGQYAISPLAPQAGFMTAATTNQLSLPNSNPGAAPGYSTGLFSARQPSLVTDRLGNPRDDLPVLIYKNGNVSDDGSTMMAFMMGDFSATPFDLDSILPGSTGSFCLDASATKIGVLMVPDANGVATLTLPVTSTSRHGLVGLDLVFSGIALDFGTGVAHAGSCGVIHL